MSRVSATAVVNGRLYCPPRTSCGVRAACRSSMMRGAPRITTRVIDPGWIVGPAKLKATAAVSLFLT